MGSSRGGFKIDLILQSLDVRRIDQLYVIGGDGTLRGGLAIHKEFQKRGFKKTIVGICKTIDNDIRIIDRSFGYQTAIDEAIRAINSGENEAFSAEYGVGLIKLMGRNSGHIALEASLSQRGVNILLIPEVEWTLNGDNGLLKYIYDYLLKHKNCLIVVAEGAGDSLTDVKLESNMFDESGNKKPIDIGLYLKDQISLHLKE